MHAQLLWFNVTQESCLVASVALALLSLVHRTVSAVARHPNWQLVMTVLCGYGRADTLSL